MFFNVFGSVWCDGGLFVECGVDIGGVVGCGGYYMNSCDVLVYVEDLL